MSNYVIWTRGLRGPSMAVLHGSPILCAYDSKRLLSGPTKIAPEHADMSFSALGRLYPPPAPPDVISTGPFTPPVEADCIPSDSPRGKLA